jgi:predicted DNA-binding transcriptional regulator YafY
MSEVARLYRYRELLTGGRAVPATELIQRLEISPATFKRDLAKLRDQLHVPVVFDREQGGYRLEQGHADSELPGLWFSQEEALALMTIQQMLTQLEPGLLGPKLKPLQQRLSDLLQKQGVSEGALAKRIRVVHAGKRSVHLKSFEVVASATLARQQIRVTHFNRQNGESVERTLSPQRLVHYRDNWYLDAWCHLRESLRSFSVDAIAAAVVLKDRAREVDPAELQRVFESGYGIFGGAPKDWAKLQFAPQRARWVMKEQWHPEQRGALQSDGSYILEFPYADERELVGDILRFGVDVVVVSPAALRGTLLKTLLAAAGRYA